MAKVPNAVEILPKIWTAWVGRTTLQTTDGRVIAYSEREGEFTFAKNGWTDRYAIWVVDSSGPKEEQVQSYSPGGAHVPTWEGTSANMIEPSICGGDAVLCQTTVTTCYGRPM